jgi:N-acetylmuramoyl-L-alanine amidase
MEILNHQIVGVPQRPLASFALAAKPRYIVIHYTEGGSVAESHQFLKSKGYSYHVMVARDGALFQCVPFSRAARHAGKSNWKGRSGVSGFSLGVCAANYGLRAAEVGVANPLTARHKAEGVTRMWERYPDAQVAAIHSVCQLLVRTYPSIVDIVGHDDVAAGRKVDPGPAFPMAELYPLVPGRAAADPGPRFAVHAPGETLTLRQAPSRDSRDLGQLEHGRVVHVRSTAYRQRGSEIVGIPWASVDLEGDLEHSGFLHTGHLRALGQ